MYRPKLVVPSCVAVIAIALGGCGTITVKPATGSRGKVDDPRTNQPNHVRCLQNQHLQVQKVGQTGLQIGSPPAGPKVLFAPTPGMAQGYQISGNRAYQGAEVIGSALLFPNQASESELNKIENCLAQGVSG